MDCHSRRSPVHTRHARAWSCPRLDSFGGSIVGSKPVKTYHVYIMSNTSKMLYVGVTGDIHRRVFEHKNKLVPGFSQKYNLHRLIYCEAFGHIRDAIAREKQIKGWLRSRKVALIASSNPGWRDLTEDWFKTSPSKADCHPEGRPFWPQGSQRSDHAKTSPRRQDCDASPSSA
jgi:putative endonuclease